jgi:hypothetical protein
LQQPFRILAGRTMMMGDVPAISLLTTMGVELILELSEDKLPLLRQAIAQEAVLQSAPKSGKPD